MTRSRSARALARAAGTRLILVAVYASDARSAVMERGAYARALAIEAESVLEWVARPLAGVSAEARAVPCTSVPRGLQEVAEAEGALAIVVGASHRGPLGRIVPGSVGERLLHGAPCPVAVAPRGYWGQAYAGIKRIGVGYVGVPEAQDALAAAVGLAARTGAAVRVLSVVEPTAVSASLYFGAGSGAARRDRARRASAATCGARSTRSPRRSRSPARSPTATPTTSSRASPARSTSWSVAHAATVRPAA